MTQKDIDRIIEMAWEDRTPFEALKFQFDFSEADVIAWENLIMANYAIDPKVLLPYLPNGVELDFYNSEIYVILVGFLFKNTRIFQIRIPGLGTFEEINLRFYVTRKEGNKVKSGVVFINEAVPNKVVAFIANSIYNEHYTAVPTKHKWNINAESKNIKYQWKIDKKWNSISVIA